MAGMAEISTVTAGEWPNAAILGYVLGKTAPPAGTVRLTLTSDGDTARVAAVDAAGTELRAWEVSLSLKDRPAISQVEIQVSLL